MDIISHILVGLNVSNFVDSYEQKAIVIFGSIIPDIGEVFIQKELNKKFNSKFGVYDERTSDSNISNNLQVTWIYDLLHSPLFYLLFMSIGIFSSNNILINFSTGGFFHLLFDFTTHGKVWALKLLFPLSNSRFPILVKTFGNWWEWKPQFSFFKIKLPIICIFVWCFLILTFLIFKQHFAI